MPIACVSCVLLFLFLEFDLRQPEYQFGSFFTARPEALLYECRF
jgi:hypothetical protein